MPHVGPVEQWDIFWVDLDPSVGSEQGGRRRPAVVVSNDGFNRVFSDVTVVPMTRLKGKTRGVYPFEVLAENVLGDGKDSILMPQQIRTISKHRLLEKAANLTEERIRHALENRILEHLGIDFEPDDDLPL